MNYYSIMSGMLLIVVNGILIRLVKYFQDIVLLLILTSLQGRG